MGKREMLNRGMKGSDETIILLLKGYLHDSNVTAAVETIKSEVRKFVMISSIKFLIEELSSIT